MGQEGKFLLFNSEDKLQSVESADKPKVEKLTRKEEAERIADETAKFIKEHENLSTEEVEKKILALLRELENEKNDDQDGDDGYDQAA